MKRESPWCGVPYPKPEIRSRDRKKVTQGRGQGRAVLPHSALLQVGERPRESDEKRGERSRWRRKSRPYKPCRDWQPRHTSPEQHPPSACATWDDGSGPAHSFTATHLGAKGESPPSQKHEGRGKERRGTERTRTGTLSDTGIDSNGTTQRGRGRGVPHPKTGREKMRGERIEESNGKAEGKETTLTSAYCCCGDVHERSIELASGLCVCGNCSGLECEWSCVHGVSVSQFTYSSEKNDMTSERDITTQIAPPPSIVQQLTHSIRRLRRIVRVQYPAWVAPFAGFGWARVLG
ncbi:hypothetical protein K438DRAFT_1774566 [Mycena galopus ATCC 62051]|nr:hypothetical protein K438DRAFT_1774566 [Mycena galopus ATCC 62051]